MITTYELINPNQKHMDTWAYKAISEKPGPPTPKNNAASSPGAWRATRLCGMVAHGELSPDPLVHTSRTDIWWTPDSVPTLQLNSVPLFDMTYLNLHTQSPDPVSLGAALPWINIAPRISSAFGHTRSHRSVTGLISNLTTCINCASVWDLCSCFRQGLFEHYSCFNSFLAIL
jgi:hypothetical protein